MGIRGLSTLLKDRGTYKELCNMKIIIDGGGFSDFLAHVWDQTSCDLVLGDCPGLLSALDSFLDCMKRKRVQIIVVFDGTPELIKDDTFQIRICEKIAGFKSVSLNKDSKEKSIDDSSKLCIDASKDIKRPFRLHYALKERKVDVRMADGEADAYIAHLAQKTGAYIFANDSDFFVLQSPGYFTWNNVSLKRWYYERNPDTPLYVLFFDPETVSQAVNVPLNYLPAFATLCANDFIKGALVDEIHSTLGLSQDVQNSAFPVKLQEIAKRLNAKIPLLRLKNPDGYRTAESQCDPFRKTFLFNKLLIDQLLQNNLRWKEIANRLYSTLAKYIPSNALAQSADSISLACVPELNSELEFFRKIPVDSRLLIAFRNLEVHLNLELFLFRKHGLETPCHALIYKPHLFDELDWLHQRMYLLYFTPTIQDRKEGGEIVSISRETWDMKEMKRVSRNVELQIRPSPVPSFRDLLLPSGYAKVPGFRQKIFSRTLFETDHFRPRHASDAVVVATFKLLCQRHRTGFDTEFDALLDAALATFVTIQYRFFKPWKPRPRHSHQNLQEPETLSISISGLTFSTLLLKIYSLLIHINELCGSPYPTEKTQCEYWNHDLFYKLLERRCKSISGTKSENSQFLMWFPRHLANTVISRFLALKEEICKV